MVRILSPLFLLCGAVRLALGASDPLLIDSMQVPTFTAPEGKARVELVEGRTGKALQFSFPQGAKSVFVTGRAHGQPDWDKAAGVSFWLKGDGSPHFGGLEFVWGENYALRYDCAFPLESKEWRKIFVPWRNLVPVLPTPGTKPIDPANGNAPSKLGQIWFGKWWYWRDDAAQSFAIEDLRLEPHIPVEQRDFRPPGAPLARVLAKLEAGQPITIVTMGDSLTDYNHWSNREINWPTLLKDALHERYKSAVTIINPAIGGTQLRQNLILIPYWQRQNPAPDLVTVFFGGNDWEAGMRGEMFLEAQKDGINRIRRATDGKADVLILSTAPTLEHWDLVGELAQACRQAASEKNAGFADIYRAFHREGATDRTPLFARDKVHMGTIGHRVVSQTILTAIADGGMAGH